MEFVSCSGYDAAHVATLVVFASSVGDAERIGGGRVKATRLESILRGRTRSDALLRDLVAVAQVSGAAPLVVGGYVRDAALRQRALDLDLSCARRTPQLVRALQSHWGRRAFRFRKRGVTTWRFIVAGRQVDLVAAARRRLAEELRRRELTINAVAYDLLAERLDDPLGGVSDLRAKRLRLPRPGVIHDDPLRALRIVRFLAQLPEFRLDPAAGREARACAPALRRAAVLVTAAAGLAFVTVVVAPTSTQAAGGPPLNTFPSWFSGDRDLTYSLAWGDVDGDGDLDLAAGNGSQNRLYLNRGGTLEGTATWTDGVTDNS